MVPLILAATLGSAVVLIVVGNTIATWRCVDTLQQYLANPDVGELESVPVFCDTSAEVAAVLDIALALSGGLVGWLAGSTRRDGDHA